MDEENEIRWKPLPRCYHGNEYQLVAGGIALRNTLIGEVDLSTADVNIINELLGGE